MYIHNIQRDTKIKFIYEDEEFEGTYDGAIDHLSFYVFCPEFSRNVEKYLDTEPKAQFIVGENMYTFTARLTNANQKKDAFLEAVEFRAVSPIKQSPLRSSFRMKVTLKVGIHRYNEDFKQLYSDGLICEAVSSDTSKGGICVWSDYWLDAPTDTKFTLELSLQQGKIYMLPAFLKRAGENTETRSYNYEYGFVFDFSEAPEKRDSLLLEILEYKIRNRG
ncbi:MAG: hypothetical protein FWG87_07465 [Defluviitaleaceae bacterium]|nr:hypothetical protein [Defluviitaleaceae bacterium]